MFLRPGQVPENQSAQKQRQPVRSLGQDNARLGDDGSPITLPADTQSFLAKPLLQIAQLSARIRPLLDSRQEASIEFRVARFDLAGELPQSRLRATMPDDEDQRGNSPQNQCKWGGE